MTMAIYVPSRSRWGRCLTLDQLGPAALQGRPVYIVAPIEQRMEYIHLSDTSKDRWGCRIPVLTPAGVRGIAATRQHCGWHALMNDHESFIMLDDDLRFVKRLNPKETDHRKRKLGPVSGDDTRKMLQYVENMMKTYAHGGIRIRQAYHDIRLGYPVETCVRALRALAYRTKEFNLCTHGRVTVMEDFDITLQLLAMGYPNAVVTHWVQDQAATQAAGGCSDYRTLQVHNDNVRKMHKLWPDVTAIREKDNKTGGEDLRKRLELTIQWKKTLGLYERQLVG